MSKSDSDTGSLMGFIPLTPAPGGQTLVQVGPPTTTAKPAVTPKPTIIVEPGFVLGGYQILKKLGSGGMGEVHIAWDEQLQRKVAIKVLRPEHQADAETHERFVREARAAAAVSHDNVVSVYQVGVQDHLAFMVMPLLRGATLETFLDRKGLPQTPQVVRIVRDVLRGLSAAHARGLIHRDIKPANIWLEHPNGRVKILDFGIAKPTTNADTREITHNGTLMGTPAYMSPEQARGHKIDARSDQFSVGVLLYRLLTGRTPFQRETIMDTLAAIAAESPISPREINRTVSPRLEQFTLRLLAKRATERFANCDQALEELRHIERELVLEKPDQGGTLALPPMQVSEASETPSIRREITEWGFEVVDDPRRSASAIPVPAKVSYFGPPPSESAPSSESRTKRTLPIMALVVLLSAVCVAVLGWSVTQKAKSLRQVAPPIAPPPSEPAIR